MRLTCFCLPLLHFHFTMHTSTSQHSYARLNRVVKCLNLLGRKVCSSMALQFRNTNYQALLVKYDFNNYANLVELLEDLLHNK